MNRETLVSVVMVIRDVERFVAEAIESILRQTFQDFEFIILDFGSTDKSKEIALSYAARDSRIRVSEIPATDYIQAKIAACLLPKGQYIAIQDADDVSLPERLQLEVEFLEKHPEVGVLGGAVQWVDSEGIYLKTAADYPTEDPEIRAELRERNAFWHPTILMRRDAYVRAGGYRVSLSLADDYDLWLRISERYQCANLPQVLLKYRIHSQQLSLRKRHQQILCVLGAQASAALREAGKPDVMNNVAVLTPSILTSMGIDEVVQKRAIAEGYRYWTKQLYDAGEPDAVVEAATELSHLCAGAGVEPTTLAEVHVLAAKAHWKQKRVLSGAISAGRAVYYRPGLLTRLLGPLLRLK